MFQSSVFEQLVEYIIKFLLRGNEELSPLVCYTCEPEKYPHCKLIIKPSGFFSSEDYLTERSLPKLPLQKVDGVELLYGEPVVEVREGRVFVEADLVASSFFLLSRYEEVASSADKFDQHGRFSGKESLPYRAGFIERPLVDEYSKLMLKWLEMAGVSVPAEKEGFSKIYLTHDVDMLGLYQHPRGFLSGIYHSLFQRDATLRSVLHSQLSIEKDPAYTFQWLMEQDLMVEGAEPWFFVKAVTESQYIYDKPLYIPHSKRLKRLIETIRESGGKIGLHSSYRSYHETDVLSNEAESLRKATGLDITANRCHYLTIQPPNRPEPYLEAGITDDFSLTYASHAGFRIGTSRPVRWINPCSLEVLPITLHPTAIMDGTLSGAEYMNLSAEEAFSQSWRIIDEARKHGGELVLLWHNTSVAEKINSYHRELYEKITKKLSKSVC